MNIEIANRLVELRKKSGLSQEELAAKLGLSRQAVSKWERAEASPDTDNLICLAKLYGVSLDTLLNTDESIDEIVKEQVQKDSPSPEEKAKEEKPSGEAASNGTSKEEAPHSDQKASSAQEETKQSTSKDGHEEIHIDSEGIHVFSSGHGTLAAEAKLFAKKKTKRNRVFDLFQDIGTPLVVFISVAVYLCLGFFYPDPHVGWGISWLVFFSIALYPTLIEALRNRSFCTFAFPVLVTGIYLLLGLYWGLWNPYWVIFLSIPIYYVVFSPIDDSIHRRAKEKGLEGSSMEEKEGKPDKEDAIDVKFDDEKK
jgi:transcriptional regulator with XRE-family HTH domain